jgi:hypothetical protein
MSSSQARRRAAGGSAVPWDSKLRPAAPRQPAASDQAPFGWNIQRRYTTRRRRGDKRVARGRGVSVRAVRGVRRRREGMVDMRREGRGARREGRGDPGHTTRRLVGTLLHHQTWTCLGPSGSRGEGRGANRGEEGEEAGEETGEQPPAAGDATVQVLHNMCTALHIVQ